MHVALAATTATFSSTISIVVGYFNDALALLSGAAVVAFIWFVIQYLIRANDKRSEGAQYIMWSLIAFFVVLSMWGLVNILVGTFDLGQPKGPASWSSIQTLVPR